MRRVRTCVYIEVHRISYRSCALADSHVQEHAIDNPANGSFAKSHQHYVKLDVDQLDASSARHFYV